MENMGIGGVFVVICFTGSLLGVNGLTIAGQVFLKNSTWDGLVMNNGYMAAIETQSAMRCSLACVQTAGCESFFYIASNGECLLFDFVFAYTTCSASEPGARYYYLEGSIPDPNASMVSGDGVYPACDPNDDSAYRTVCLADSTPFTYRVYRTVVNQAGALAGCHNEGTELIKVLTWPKMQFLRHLIYNCSDYDMYSFWMDGSNALATDFTDITQWVTEHGDSLPGTTQFWVSGHPNSPTIDHCVPMWRSLGYYWTDRPCSDLFPYICEVPNL